MKISNKRAYYDYQINETIEAGVNLLGSEVKAVKMGHADLTGSFVRITGSEAYLINAKIFPYEYSRPENYDERRTRKLLLHKNEIISLKTKSEGKNIALVPISLYEKHGLIKLEVGVGRGKRQIDKKEAKKQADITRDIEAELASQT